MTQHILQPFLVLSLSRYLFVGLLLLLLDFGFYLVSLVNVIKYKDISGVIRIYQGNLLFKKTSFYIHWT